MPCIYWSLHALEPVHHNYWACTPQLESPSVQFSCSVMSNSLWPYGLQQARLPCPSPTTRLAQTHVSWVGDAIQPSHPLLSPSPPTFNLSQHQCLFKWVSIRVLKMIRIKITSCSGTQFFLTLCELMDCTTPGFPVLHYLPETAPTQVHWIGDAIQPFHPLSPPSPLALHLSQHQGCFQWFSSSHQVAKYWSFSFSISPSSEYSGLISFRMDWLDLLEVQGTLKSLLQHHSSKASILQHPAFFIVQISHPYMTTGKKP